MRIFVGALPTGQQAEFQEHELIKGVVNLIRVDNNIDKALEYMSVMKQSPVVVRTDSTDGPSEWHDIILVLWPRASGVTVAGVQASKTRLATNKDLRRWRPLPCFQPARRS